MIDQGYRNIAYLAQQRYRTSIERCHGYISALQCRGIEVDHRRILMLDGGTPEKCCHRLKEVLKSDVPLDSWAEQQLEESFHINLEPITDVSSANCAGV